MRTAFFSCKSYDREYFERFNGESEHELVYFEASLGSETAGLADGFGAVCIFVNDRADRETLGKLREHGVGLIALRSAGFNHVDLEAAREFGLTVMRVPAYSPHAVAEHALALILTLNRKTHKAYNRVRDGNFSLENLTGFNLYGKTVGVIGTGEIGSVFCKIMQGIGCRVIASDPVRSGELQERGVAYMETEDLLAESDIVSLHCPLNDHTRHLIDRDALARMKRGSMLINTGRGALVQTRDVIEALKSGRLGHLGLDVYEQEEDLFFRDLSENIIQDELILRLMTFPNVLITSHQGFFTREALEQIATITLRNITDYEKGSASGNEITLDEA